VTVDPETKAVELSPHTTLEEYERVKRELAELRKNFPPDNSYGFHLEPGNRDPEGRLIVLVKKRPKETEEAYFDRCDKEMIGKRFLASGRITSMHVLRDIKTGTCEHVQVVMTQQDVHTIALLKQKADEAAAARALAETTLDEHRELRKRMTESNAAEFKGGEPAYVPPSVPITQI